MAEERYIFVVMDSAGGLTRRYAVSRRLLFRLAGGLTSLALLGGFLIIHAIYSHSVAQESIAIARQNDSLREQLRDNQVELDLVLDHSAQTTRVALQVFEKAGLEREASLLAAGPVTRGEPRNIAAGAESAPAPVEQPFLGGGRTQWERRIYSLDSSLGHLVEYFRDADRLLLNTPATNPAPSGWFTSKFGMRIHPVHGNKMMHKGQDIAGSIGLKVFAPADGTVIWASTRGGYGRTIVLDHGYGLQTHFAHLDAYRVKVGEPVRRGDLIGLMGNSGVSTGPHLHYEVRRHGRPLNPNDFILD